jgi:hypothetical protein
MLVSIIITLMRVKVTLGVYESLLS